MPHPRLNPTEKTEFEKQVDELSLEIKPQCLVLINIHVYEDKFRNYLLTKGVGQTKDVDIYDRSIFKIFEDAIMGEYNDLQIINSFSVTVKFNGASPLILFT